MKLFETFKAFREERPNDAAFLITSGDRSLPISWWQFTEDIDAVAWLIRTQAPGGKIGIIGENSYEWVVCHAACLFTDATAVPLDPNLRPDEIVDRLRFVGASVLVHSALYVEKVREVAKLLPGLATGGFGTLKTDMFLEGAHLALAANVVKSLWNGGEPDPSRTSMLVFTSGTTTKPRGAELTTSGLEAFIDSAASVLELRRGQRSLMLLPLHHIFGIATTYFMLASGVPLGVCPDFRRVYDAVERFRVNFLFLVPALAEILGSKIEQHRAAGEDDACSTLDWILTGGAPLPRRIYEHLTALGIKMLTGYGLTETTALYSIAPFSGDPHVGSAGKVSQNPEVETKVSDSGELLIRGPAVLKGYYRDPANTAKVFENGWFKTGDLGSIDADGFVWITGRASRTIVLSSGKKIAPEELEEELLSLPGVLEAVVTGESETREVKAEVYGKVPEARIRAAIARLNAILPVYKRISTVVVRTEPFPRTSSGKIRLG